VAVTVTDVAPYCSVEAIVVVEVAGAPWRERNASTRPLKSFENVTSLERTIAALPHLPLVVIRNGNDTPLIAKE
jgi:hypothetical protein